MNAPCKDCENRVIGCHAVCEKYKAFDAENKKRHRENLERLDQESLQYNAIRRCQRRRWRHER